MRGWTLIELMVAIAMVGIGVGALGTAAWNSRRQAIDASHEARALLVLEAEAEAHARGSGRGGHDMAAELPGYSMSRSALDEDGTVTLSVGWKSSRGLRSRSLKIFAKEAL